MSVLFLGKLTFMTLAAFPAGTLDKEAVTQQMLAIGREIQALKGTEDAAIRVDSLQRHYQVLSQQLGGDDPAGILVPAARPGQPGGVIAIVGIAPPGTTATATNFANNTPTAILDVATVMSTINVTTADTYLWDIDLRTFITHTFAADLDITLTSPAGTVVTLTTDNGVGTDNVFNGTTWDDSATSLTIDHAYVNNVVATPLVPEGALGFTGEDPNGTWTITIVDDLLGDVGSLVAWDLNVTTLAPTPVEVLAQFTNSTPTAIVDVATVTSNLLIAGAGTSITNIDLTTFLTHTFAADLDITLTSPAGTVVGLTTDNGVGTDNVFNGTTWDDSAPTPTTDHAYVNNVVATTLAPEGALGRLLGEDPNGTWTITITDDLSGDVGSLNSWRLDLTTGEAAAGPTTPTFTPYCSGAAPAPCNCGNNGAPGNGCANGVYASGANLTAIVPDPYLMDDPVDLVASGMTPLSLCLFIQGSLPANGGLGVPLGDGLLCVSGSVVRLGIRPTFLGTSHLLVRPPGFTLSTVTSYYQSLYITPGVFDICGAAGRALNATNGVAIDWGF